MTEHVSLAPLDPFRQCSIQFPQWHVLSLVPLMFFTAQCEFLFGDITPPYIQDIFLVQVPNFIVVY